MGRAVAQDHDIVKRAGPRRSRVRAPDRRQDREFDAASAGRSVPPLKWLLIPLAAWRERRASLAELKRDHAESRAHFAQLSPEEADRQRRALFGLAPGLIRRRQPTFFGVRIDDPQAPQRRLRCAVIFGRPGGVRPAFACLI